MEIKIKDGEEVKIVQTSTNMGKEELKRLVESEGAETDESGTVVIDINALQRMREATAGHLIAGAASLGGFGDAMKACQEDYSPYPKADKPKRRGRCNHEAKAVASEKKRVKRIKRKKAAKDSKKRNRK